MNDECGMMNDECRIVQLSIVASVAAGRLEALSPPKGRRAAPPPFSFLQRRLPRRRTSSGASNATKMPRILFVVIVIGC